MAPHTTIEPIMAARNLFTLEAVVPGDFGHGLRIAIAAFGVGLQTLKCASEQAVRSRRETDAKLDAVSRPGEPVRVGFRPECRILGNRLGGEENFWAGVRGRLHIAVAAQQTECEEGALTQ